MCTSSIEHTRHRPSASTDHHPARKYNFATQNGIDPLLLPSFWCALSPGKSSKSSDCNLISFGSQKIPLLGLPAAGRERQGSEAWLPPPGVCPGHTPNPAENIPKMQIITGTVLRLHGVSPF